MKIEILKIKDLIPYGKNARKHPQKQIDLLARNIERFGFTTPCLIDGNNELIAGHGRLLAMQKLGKEEVPCVRIEGLSEDEIKALKKEHKRIKRDCGYCEVFFSIFLSAVSGKTNASGNFCSRGCYNKWLKTRTGNLNPHFSEKVKLCCSECETEIYRTVVRKNLYKNHFCSNSCRALFVGRSHSGELNANWRGGHIQRKGNFASVKSKYFSSPQFCGVCGKSEKIHIHHIVPFRDSKDNSVKNLIPLCRSHHRSIEILTWKLMDVFNDREKLSTCLRVMLRGYQMENFFKKSVQIRP